MKKLSLFLFLSMPLPMVHALNAQMTTRAIVAKVKYLPSSLDAQFVAIISPGHEDARILELKYTAREVVMDVRAIIDSTHTSIEKDQAYLVFRDQLNIQEVETLIAILKTLARQVADAKYSELYQHEVIYPVAPHLSVKRIQNKNHLYLALELYKTNLDLRKNWIQEFIQSLEDGLQQLKAYRE